MPVATQIDLTTGPLTRSDAELLAVPVAAAGGSQERAPATADPAALLAELRPYLPAEPERLLRFYGLDGVPGEVVELVVALESRLARLVLFGVGSGRPAQLRGAGAALARHAAGRQSMTVVLPEPEGTSPTDAAVAAFAEGLLLAGYRYTCATKANGSAAVARVDLLAQRPESHRAGLARGQRMAAATALTRDLTNTPSSTKDPEWLAQRAREVASRADLTVRVWDEEQLARDGFGAILAVGRGSASPPRLVELRYEPPRPRRHVALVGKGISFDTGGLSLKPSEAMQLMKTDMAGAGVVLGVMSQLARARVPVRVTGLLALAENAFSGSAQRPSDVLTTYGGRTVEVLNTDAEGRLVLADALDYAVAQLRPDVLVDVATLTGAARVTLGNGLGALFASEDRVAESISDAGERAGEPLWRLPLVEDYADSLRSQVADLSNIGTKDDYGKPGAVEAALFLREFTGGIPWAHLDLAGAARASADSGAVSKGATGFGSRLLLSWLEELKDDA